MLNEHTITQISSQKHKIDQSRLKPNQYTMSLLNEGYRLKLIDLNTVHTIQFDLMNLLKELILRYTNGESSSVTNDTAEGLLCSILYAIDACTLSCNSPEEAICKLREEKIEDVYRKGVERIVQWFEETKRLYLTVWKNRLDIPLESYKLTLSEIPLFLEKYNILFWAHNAVASIDYPLVFDDMSIQGVLYMKNYLTHLKLESDFCRLFETQELNELLLTFGNMIRMDYKIELINVFELTYNNAIFSIISGRDNIGLIISHDEAISIIDTLYSTDSQGISKIIKEASELLKRHFDIKEKYTVDYLNRYKESFVKRVINAKKNKSLDSIIVTRPQESKNRSILSLRLGERLEDKQFKSLVSGLTGLSTTEERITLIKQQISSLHDFIDILSGDCFFGDEYIEVFNSLGVSELAVLAKIVFYEEIRDGTSGLYEIASQYYEPEYEWQDYFVKYIRTLQSDRLTMIEKYIRNVDYEEITFY